MSQHAEVIRTALDRLYQRITNPTATDAASHRIARKAVDQLDNPEGKSVDITGMTIARAQAVVESNQVSAADALEQEKGARARTTLISWLEDRL